MERMDKGAWVYGRRRIDLVMEWILFDDRLIMDGRADVAMVTPFLGFCIWNSLRLLYIT